MINNPAKSAGRSAGVMGSHHTYVTIAQKYPAYAKNGIEHLEAVLDKANEMPTVVALGSNAEATQQVVCALLSCRELPPAAAHKKALRYVAPTNTAELQPIAQEHLANLTANYVTLTLTPKGEDKPISGPIVAETEETVTLKVFDKTRKERVDRQVNKTDLMITQVKIVDVDGNETVCSVAPESLNTDGTPTLDANEIVLKDSDGSEVKMDTFDIQSWEYTTKGERRVSPYKALFTPNENDRIPPASNMPLAPVGNANTQTDVAPDDIEWDNPLLGTRLVRKRAILVMPSLDVFHENVAWHVYNAEALLVVLSGTNGRIRTEEKTLLEQIRSFNQNIFFVQDKIHETGETEWKAVRRKNVQDIAASLDQAPNDITKHYFPVSSALKISAENSTTSAEKQARESLSKFPRLIQQLEALNTTETKKQTDRNVLESIRFEAVTLKLILSHHHDKSQWTDDVLEKFQKRFQTEYDKIQRKTQRELAHMFGSSGISPLVGEFMGDLDAHNLEPEQLQNKSDELLADFIQRIHEKTSPIFEDHFKKIYALPYQLVKAAPPPPSTDAATHLSPLLCDMTLKHSVDEASEELHHRYRQNCDDEFSNINNLFKLSSTPGSLGQILQSMMFPIAVGSSAVPGLVIKGAALGAALANPAVAVPLATFVVLTALGGAATFFNRREGKQQQKEKNRTELRQFAAQICNYIQQNSLNELNEVQKTYTETLQNVLDACTDRSAELDTKQLNADIQNLDTLLESISEQLPGLERKSYPPAPFVIAGG